jgi:DNA-binding NarL/FixJ family response regulator
MSRQSERPHILFVDDEPRILEAFADLLRTRPYRLSFATSGEEALEILRGDGADVLVTDERMPGLQGSELCALVAEEFPRTPRLIVTGHATVDVAMHAINEGCVTGFLMKPVRAVELEHVLARALKARTIGLAQDRFVRAASALASSVPPRKAPSIAVGDFEADAMRRLSAREREVFDLLVEGYRVSQIAKMLFRSHHTVRNHLKAIFEKLGVSSQEEVVLRARGG